MLARRLALRLTPAEASEGPVPALLELLFVLVVVFMIALLLLRLLLVVPAVPVEPPLADTLSRVATSCAAGDETVGERGVGGGMELESEGV